MEKNHREKGHNTEKTQGKHREFNLGWNVATLKLINHCGEQTLMLTIIIMEKLCLDQNCTFSSIS